AKAEKHIFLKHSLGTRLTSIHLDLHYYHPALTIIEGLPMELKRLDDKLILLTEVHLLESKVYCTASGISQRIRCAGRLFTFLISFGQMQAALTSACTIYMLPPLQLALYIQSSSLRAEEKDYKTAYSYFLKVFESLAS
ncbi:hypothetical protein GGX14DRAFT_305835, partial [Mycena pura]